MDALLARESKFGDAFVRDIAALSSPEDVPSAIVVSNNLLSRFGHFRSAVAYARTRPRLPCPCGVVSSPHAKTCTTCGMELPAFSVLLWANALEEIVGAVSLVCERLYYQPRPLVQSLYPWRGGFGHGGWGKLDGNDSALAIPKNQISNASCLFHVPYAAPPLDIFAFLCPTFHDGPQICLPKPPTRGAETVLLKTVL